MGVTTHHVDRNGTWNYPWWFFSTARFNPGGPAWYGASIRMPATFYMQRPILEVIIAALAFTLVLIVILPTIKHRLHTFIAAINSLSIGLAIALCMLCPDWLSGYGVIHTAMDYHHPKVYDLSLGIHVGLAAFNVTLKNVPSVIENNTISKNNSKLNSRMEKFYYNEEVKMYYPEHMEGVLSEALERGLPIPILDVYSCLTSSELGFEWSHRILESGYHCYLVLAFALSGWFANQVLIAAIPRYSCYAFISIGIMMFATSVIYFYWSDIIMALPCMVISDVLIELQFGVCFWVCLTFGIWSIIYGFSLAVYDVVHPDKFLTVFDLDYDHKRALCRAHKLNHLPANEAFRERPPEFYQSTKL